MSLFFQHVSGNESSPVIIIHGFLGCSDNWKTVAKTLSKNHSVYMLDMRNHGRSFHDQRMTYEDMAQDVEQFVIENRLNRPILIGHSMGGKIAMAVALRRHIEISRLIVVDIAPKRYAPEHTEILNALQTLDLNVGSRQDLDRQLSQTIASPILRQFLLKTIARSETTFKFKINLPALIDNYDHVLDFPFSPEYQPVAAQVDSVQPDETQAVDVQAQAADAQGTYPFDIHFIKGERSAYIQASDVSIIDAYFSRYSLDVVPNAGHWVHAENPKEFMDVLLTYIG